MIVNGQVPVPMASMAGREIVERWRGSCVPEIVVHLRNNEAPFTRFISSALNTEEN